MKNEYKTLGDVTEIYVTTRKGKLFKVLIDTEDLQLLDQFDNQIGVGYYKGVEDYYAKISSYQGWNDEKQRYDYKTLMLHRIILNEKGSAKVDHINHNTLDNRKTNLRSVKQENNLKHRSKKNLNNRSGYRNVSFVGEKWVVQLQIEGKNTVLGKFDNVDDAGVFAEKMRKKHYGEFHGES